MLNEKSLPFALALLALTACRSERTPVEVSWSTAVKSDRTALAKKLSEGSIQPTEAPEEEESIAEDRAFEGRTGGEGGSEYRGPGDVAGAPTPPSAGPTTAGPTTGRPSRAPDGMAARSGVVSRGLAASLDDVSSGLESVDGVAPKKADEGKKKDAPRAKSWKRSARRFARVEVGRDEDGVKTLELAKLRVTVRIDGHRARTVVDHVFENPFDQQLEGRFTYPLPTGASACYYGMFLSPTPDAAPPLFDDARIADLPEGGLTLLSPDDVLRRADDRWGKLREARVVRREQGRKVYEQIVRKNIDPALLEKEAGNRFVGRVFPIPAKGFNRVVLAWEETLVRGSDGAFTYRFPLPAEKLEWLRFEASTTKGEWANETFRGPGKPVRQALDNSVLHRIAAEKESVGGGEISWRLVPRESVVQRLSGPDPVSGKLAFAARIEPALPIEAARDASRHGVFLLDTSLSEDPERFAVHVRLMREILTRDTKLERFQVLCFDVGAWRVGGKSWLDNDASTRAAVLRELDKVLLEGATDISAVVDRLAALEADGDDSGKRPLAVFFLSNGEVTWGDDDPRRLLARAATNVHWEPTWYCYRSGVGAENVTLFDALTRRGGATFQVPDEQAAQRVAIAHRRKNFVIDKVDVSTDKGPARDIVIRGREVAIPAGGDVVLAGHAPTGATRGTITMEGRIGNDAHIVKVPFELGGASELAARAWSVIAVEQMLALDDPRIDRLATAYAQRYRIGTRATSFLVLETDAEYELYEIGKESAELRVDDVRAFLADAYRFEKPTTRRVAFGRFLRSTEERMKLAQTNEVRDLFARMRESDFEVPRLTDYGELPVRRAVARQYLDARTKDRRDFKNYIRAAERRVADRRGFLALRSLSSIVELEPSRSDALRLVGYRLLGMDRPDLATSLFERIRDSRPFEPHGYRDLARTLERLGKPALAALHYELVLAGTWDGRFGESMKVVTSDEYRRLLRTSLRAGKLDARLTKRFESRLDALGRDTTKPEVRVTISWNTDNTDVDLWVVEPSGEACGYNHQETKSGGRLLEDLTGGYGPERYENAEAPPGEYVILVKYYSDNPNLIGNETHVEVVVTRNVGTPREELVRYDVVLERDEQAIEVCRIRI